MIIMKRIKDVGFALPDKFIYNTNNNKIAIGK